jgi:diguanylate cyclase (GGDEF)-like protein/PAS domain S-box-containing protein
MGVPATASGEAAASQRSDSGAHPRSDSGAHPRSDSGAHPRHDAHVRELAIVTLEAIGEGVIRTSSSGRVDYMNPAAEKLTGWQADDAVGRDISEVYNVYSEATRRPRRNAVELCLAERTLQVPPGLSNLRTREGDELTIRDSISPILGDDGEVLGAVVVFRDLTRVRSLEREMAYITSHDPLTGLLNRQDFEIYLEAALEQAGQRAVQHALLYLDLVELKLVNDCYGHVAGDELLRQIAQLLRGEVGEEVILGRVGGGDFSLLLENHDTEQAQAFARSLQRAVASFRFGWGGQHLEIAFNIGLVAIGGGPTATVQSVLKAADSASYRARQRGRNKIHVFDVKDGLDERHGRLHWVQKVRRALAEDRFVLYHQEIEALHPNGKGLHEILLRMVGDQGEPLAPGLFIPIAEAYNLAPLIDRWVLRKSFELLAGGALGSDKVSINLSGQSLGDETFLEDALSYLKSSRVDTSRIYFEITETNAVAHLGRALRFIGALKEKGCRFILDDFGSGFSSFSYLRNLPVELLKIDGQLVRDMARDPVLKTMVRSIHEVSHSIGLKTIAEWIEDESTLEALRELGIDYGQGFLLHRPEPIV